MFFLGDKTLIVIVGGKGNMGTRYGRILDDSGVGKIVLDLDSNELDWSQAMNRASGVLIATPTTTHTAVLAQVIAHRRDVPILCEKPVSKELDQVSLSHMANLLEARGINLQMVDQYRFVEAVSDPSVNGWTIYESFHSGNDGADWDCINIIAKADHINRVKLDVKSPLRKEDGKYWNCWINGGKIELADVIKSYSKMLAHWLKDPMPNYDYIKTAHAKVWEYKHACVDAMSTGC